MDGEEMSRSPEAPLRNPVTADCTAAFLAAILFPAPHPSNRSQIGTNYGAVTVEASFGWHQLHTIAHNVSLMFLFGPYHIFHPTLRYWPSPGTLPGPSTKRLSGNGEKLTYSPAVSCNWLCLAGVWCLVSGVWPLFPGGILLTDPVQKLGFNVSH